MTFTSNITETHTDVDDRRNETEEKGTGTPSARLIAILPTFRRESELVQTLSEILRQRRVPDEIVIVDNGCDPNLAANITRAIPTAPGFLTWVTPRENLGSAGGWSFGLAQVIDRCRGDDWILVLDDDDPPRSSDEIDEMWKFAREQRALDNRVAGVGIVGARFNWFVGIIQRHADKDISDAVDVDYVGNGHVAMYSAQVLRDFGFFNNDLFFGYTEVEFGLRLRRAGFRLVANGRLWRQRRSRENRLGMKVHRQMTVSSSWRRYYVIRNHIYLLRCHGRWDLAILQGLFQSLVKPGLTLSRSPRLALHGLRIGLRATFDGLLGRLGRRIQPTP